MENTTPIVPVLNLEDLQKKANEYAQKGAEKTLEEFYSGYHSPYRKAIEENLKNKGVGNNFDIPDIIAVLNEKIAQEIDIIANTAISKTFIPLVKDFLIREDSNIKFSGILKEFIEYTNFDHDENEIGDYEVILIERHEGSNLNLSFPTYQITNGIEGFELHFYNNKNTITLMSLPYMLSKNQKYYREYETKETMKISLDGGATLELPFKRGILENPFLKYCARIIIGKCNIEFDCNEFSEEMFPEREECHC